MMVKNDILIQKSDKGISVVVLNWQDYITPMIELLCGTLNLEMFIQLENRLIGFLKSVKNSDILTCTKLVILNGLNLK